MNTENTVKPGNPAKYSIHSLPGIPSHLPTKKRALFLLVRLKEEEVPQPCTAFSLKKRAPFLVLLLFRFEKK